MNNKLTYTVFETRLGYFGLLCHENKVLRTSLPISSYGKAERYLLVGMFNAAKNDKLLLTLQNKIKDHFSGQKVDFSDYLPAFCGSKASKDSSDWNLSTFGQNILRACSKIPYGQTVSYSELASKAGHPNAARAVGNIMGKNPLPLIIPCHRVIKSDGKPGGFMQNAPGATKLKSKMLEIENCHINT